MQTLLFPTSSVAIIITLVSLQSMFEDRIEFSPLMRGGRNYWQESSSLESYPLSHPTCRTSIGTKHASWLVGIGIIITFPLSFDTGREERT